MDWIQPALIEAAARHPEAPADPQVWRHHLESPFAAALGETGSAAAGLADRLALFARLTPVFARTMTAQGIADPDPLFLFDFLVPLLQFVLPVIERPAARGSVIGLAGGPGVGKTTLSRLMVACFDELFGGRRPSMRVSIDDFYLSREVREARGFAWRTLPGTHDLDRLAAFLGDFDARRTPLCIPRYDLGRDCPAADDVLEQSPEICVFDGAMVGSVLPGYDRLATRIDSLIFLDASLKRLKKWRFSREAQLRLSSGGTAGFSHRRMQAFWDEALAPSVVHHVRPNRHRADLVLRLGRKRRLRRVEVPSAPIEKADPHGQPDR